MEDKLYSGIAIELDDSAKVRLGSELEELGNRLKDNERVQELLAEARTLEAEEEARVNGLVVKYTRQVKAGELEPNEEFEEMIGLYKDITDLRKQLRNKDLSQSEGITIQKCIYLTQELNEKEKLFYGRFKK